MKRGVCISDKFNHKPYYYAAPTLTEVYSQSVYTKRKSNKQQKTKSAASFKKFFEMIKSVNNDKFNYKPYYYAAPTLSGV